MNIVLLKDILNPEIRLWIGLKWQQISGKKIV